MLNCKNTLCLALLAVCFSMLDELVKKHSGVWHIHLPAATLRLCCTNHPTTKEKPFACLCASDSPFFSSPRELPVSYLHFTFCQKNILNPHNSICTVLYTESHQFVCSPQFSATDIRLSSFVIPSTKQTIQRLGQKLR